MDLDLILEGRMYVNGGLKSMAVGIDGGKIATIGKLVSGDCERIDFGEKVILPGFIDPHVHFRDPGMTQKEDFSTGTMSALFGGVTCALDMPNTSPPVTDVRTLMDKRDAVRSKANIDYGLFAALTPECNTNLLAPLVVGFKLFMGSTTGNILMNDDPDIARAMADVARTGKRVSVHAEDDSMIIRGDERDNWDHLRDRPVTAEHNAVRRLGRFKGMKVNICHVTDADTLAAAASYGFTTEVTAHHLFFNAADSHGAEFKVNPPLRDIATRDRLFKAFMADKATMFGSDHAPHTMTEKSGDYASAPGGIPGVETTMPIFAELVKRGSFPLERLVRMGAEAPATAFSLNKGKIVVGYDADFAIFDMHDEKEIKVDDLHSRAGHTPYEGWTAIFPSDVMLRGQFQIRNGEYCGERMGRDVCDKS
jgi:dihydroorotase